MTNPVRSPVLRVKCFGLSEAIEQRLQVVSSIPTDLQGGSNIGKHAFTEGRGPTERVLVQEVELSLEIRHKRTKQPREGRKNQHRSTGVEFRYPEIQQQLTSVCNVAGHGLAIVKARILRENGFTRNKPLNGQVGVGESDCANVLDPSLLSARCCQPSSVVFLIPQSPGVMRLPLGNRPCAHNSHDREDRLHPSRNAAVVISERDYRRQRNQPDRQDHCGRATGARQYRSNIVRHDVETDTVGPA